MRRFEQSILRETTCSIPRALEKVLTIRNHRFSLRKLRQHLELSVEFSRQPHVIRIQKSNKLATHESRPGVARAARTVTMFESQHAYLCAKLALEHLSSVISRSIVDDNHLNFAGALHERAANRVANELRTVPRRNHNAEQWSFHFAKRT